MDPIKDTVILEYFKGTLVLDPQIRKHSELELTKLARVPGFLGYCAKIINNNDANSGIAKEIRIACAVYFKNIINRKWDSGDVSIEDKAFIKANFVEILVNSEYNIKQQLLPTLRILILKEFYDWMQILEQINQILVIPDSEFLLNKTHTAILCLSEITRSYRWIRNNQRKELDIIIQDFFPRLLAVGELLLKHPESLTEFKAEILKLILKCYKFSTYFDLPAPLQTKELVIKWGQFHGSLINISVPSYAFNPNLSENEKNMLQVSKMLKWSLANIHRLISKYVVDSSFKYDQFKSIFVNEFLSYLIHNLVGIIEMWCEGTRWLNLSALYYLIGILEISISLKSIWVQIKIILPRLIQYFLYPIITLGSDQIEIFETEPHEYINLTFNAFFVNSNAPNTAAISFIKRLMVTRKSFSFDMIMKFIHDELLLLVNSEETQEVALKKEAILRIIGAISGSLVKIHENKYYYQMEEMLMNLILPNVRSKHGFLVARTYDILGNFSDLNFQSEDNLNMVIYEILRNFGLENDLQESNLAIELENSLCIQSYLHIDQFKENLSLIILPVMSKLLKLSNEIDNDAISVVMQECVENFSDQLQPFGVELMSLLVANLMRILSEQSADDLVTNEYEEVTTVDQYSDDKIIAGIGILNTIITVLLSFENDKAIISELTKILIPVVKYILLNKNENYLTEISEIIENLTYLNKNVTNELFEILQLINELINDGTGIMYFEELLPALKNFLIYYKEPDGNSDNERINEQQFIETYLNIFTKVNDNLDSFYDCVTNFELIQYFILIMKVKLISCFNIIISQVIPLFKVIESPEAEDSLHFQVSFLNILICLLIYESNLVIISLKEKYFNLFLKHWFSVIPLLTRSYDLKLSILGLISLINNNNLMPNVELSNNLVFLLKKLPASMKDLERRRKLFSDYNSEELVNSNARIASPYPNGLGTEDGADSDEDVVNDAYSDHNEYLNFLNEENMKLAMNEEELAEDPMEITPLDNINLTEILDNFLSLLKLNNNDKFVKLFSKFPEKELQNYISLN